MKLPVKCTLLLLLLFVGNSVFAQLKISRIDPQNWFVGMQRSSLQLLIQGSGFEKPVITCAYPGVKVSNTAVMANNQYVVVDLELSTELKAGKAQFVIEDAAGKTKVNYMFKAVNPHRAQRLTAADNIYLLTPDRFANGNPKNDVVKGMHQTTLNRADDYQRHGGDLQGVINHIPYLKDLGVTALWLNPVYENNQEHESYHGYAITDHYAIDPRLGDSDLYMELAQTLHAQNMKLVKDVVFNHFGSKHYLIQNLPAEDWLNNWPTFTKSNFRAPTIFDPYAAESDKAKFQNGWFDGHMPDMNQQNPYVANYLIQNSIWWIATYGIDAYRIDTYAYSDQQFMANWAAAILEEFPQFFMFGETWVHGQVVQSYFVNDAYNHRPFPSNLESVTDFQMYYALTKTVTEDFGWTNGVASVYYCLAQDLIYKHPENLVTFLDNHDLGRFYGVAGKDLQKFKLGYGMLFTTRGIPQILYGSEILMGHTENHGKIREDFWGGWPSDTVNKFEATGRTAQENEAFEYLKRLMNWRQTSAAITRGKLVQYIPEDGVYVYFRIAENSRVMVMVNASNKIQQVQAERFAEHVNFGQHAYDWASDKPFVVVDIVEMQPYEIKILAF